MNRMLRCVATVAPCICFSLAAAAEVYQGSLKAPDNFHREIYWSLTLKYDLKADNTISGMLHTNPSGLCFKGEGRQVSGVIEGDTLSFETAASELKGCGINKFRGTRDGDAWVGTINFQGGRRDITLKKQ